MSMTPPPPPPPPGGAPPPPPPPPPLGDLPGADGPVAPTGVPLAGPWLRILARVLDGVILGLVFGAIFAGIVLSGDEDAGLAGFGADASFGKVYALGLLSVAAGFVWDAVCTKVFGGTPMKLAFGMRVVRADNGGDVEWRHAILRWVIPGALSLVPLPVLPGLANIVVVIVSLVFIFTQPLRQAVWDKIGGTLVVRSR